MSDQVEPEISQTPADSAAAEERVDAAREATGYRAMAGAVALRKTLFGWVSRHEQSLSALSMVGGFAFDNFAYRRIDLPNTQLLFMGYLLLAATSIALLHLFATRAAAGKPMPRWHSLLPMAAQFALGALWSGFLVFYTRGAVLAVSWPFLLVLVGILIGNEVFKKYHSQLVFTTILFFFALYSYAIVTVPLFTRGIGTLTFVLSGFIALFAFMLYLRLIKAVGREQWSRARWQIAAGALLVFGALNAFYFTGSLPPLPVALADGGVYHFVAKTGDVYQADAEPQPWFTRFGATPVIHIAPGQPLYVYAAVFAPISFHTTIVDHWKHYNRIRGKWITVSRVTFTINGGRDGGYRNYTVQHKVWDGDWRVDVDTADGRIIGRVPFTVEMVPQPVATTKLTLK